MPTWREFGPLNAPSWRSALTWCEFGIAARGERGSHPPGVNLAAGAGSDGLTRATFHFGNCGARGAADSTIVPRPVALTLIVPEPRITGLPRGDRP